VVVSLLFQPRRPRGANAPTSAAATAPRILDRGQVLVLALEAAVRGDTSLFVDYFTHDVTFTGPHLALSSRASAQRSFDGPEDGLTDLRLVVHSVDAIADKLIAEWRLEATFSGPLLFDDDLLIEPTGRPVRMRGVSVAEFRGARIAAFRHYFDDSELFDDVPGVPAHLRWIGASPDRPS
jgi:ketosteroid isomerase-like protein